MAKFKIGDRVVLVEHGGYTKPKLKIGQQGTVVTISPASNNPFIGVCWDGLKNGHNIHGTLSDNSVWGVYAEYLRLVVEEAKPETERPPAEPVKPRPPKPPKPQHWFTIDESDLDDILNISFEIKPASECSKPKPQAAARKPKPEPKKETKPKEDGCWKCAAYQQIADCEHGFCSAWHNFAGKDELCTRFKAVETVDK